MKSCKDCKWASIPGPTDQVPIRAVNVVFCMAPVPHWVEVVAPMVSTPPLGWCVLPGEAEKCRVYQEKAAPPPPYDELGY